MNQITSFKLDPELRSLLEDLKVTGDFTTMSGALRQLIRPTLLQSLNGQYIGLSLRADMPFNDLCGMLLKHRRFMRGVKGYVPIYGKEPPAIMCADDAVLQKELVREYRKAPIKFVKILGPDDKEERLRAVVAKNEKRKRKK